jgi:hypothetical protein
MARNNEVAAMIAKYDRNLCIIKKGPGFRASDVRLAESKRTQDIHGSLCHDTFMVQNSYARTPGKSSLTMGKRLAGRLTRPSSRVVASSWLFLFFK